MDGLEAGARAQIENIEAAMREQLASFRANASQTGTLYDDVMGFYYAIDWSETWLRGLLAFHIFVWLFAIVTRKANEVQMVLLLSILGLIYCAERLNRLAGEHWKEFAAQNYFDERGVFVSVMLSAPLLCVAFFILLNALRGAAQLLVEVKKMEFKQEARKKAKAGKKDK